MVIDVYTTVDGCQQRVMEGTMMKHQRYQTLFPLKGLLKLIEADISGRFPRMKSGNQLIVIISDHYSKVTSEISTSVTSKAFIATTIVDLLATPYSIPSFFIMDNGLPFVAK